MRWKTFFAAVGSCVLGLSVSAAAAETVVTFENGTEGWTGAEIVPGFGNPAPSLHTMSNYTFITAISNSINATFLGDYTQWTAVRLGLDVNTHSIENGMPLEIELRDYDNPPPGYSYVSVWYKLGILDPTYVGWHTWSVTIADTSTAALPPGWYGTGAYTLDPFEVHLPADRTFASVLAGVDRVVLTTDIGIFYGEAFHDVSLDNIFIQSAGPGDVNFDAVVDIFDVNFVSAHWSLTGPDADANGDGMVDILDINLISAHWTAAGGVEAAVPEPSTLVLAALVLAGALVRITK
jgi:hypothetical protein